ncbi:MAG: hypothetical protein ACLRZ9_12395 [Eubacterium sp.]
MAENLMELLKNSSSTRNYFVSLPVQLQVMLHEQHSYIRTSAQLHLISDILQKQVKF